MRMQLLVVAGLIGSAAWGASDKPRFQFTKPVNRSSGKDEALIACLLDSDIYQATRDGFPDLRVLADGTTETPFQIEKVSEFREQSVRKTTVPKVLQFKEEGQSIEVRLQSAQDTAPAEGLTIDTPLKDFERKVRIFGSADGTEWTPLKEAVVFDYSRYMDVRNTDVALPANSARQLKVIIDNVQDEKESPIMELTRTLQGGQEARREERLALYRRPFRMDRISTWYHVKQQNAQRTKATLYSVARFTVENDLAKKQTRVDIETHREPLTSLTMETSSRNFHRRITIEILGPPAVPRPGRKAEPAWNQIGESTISRIGLRKSAHEKLKITFPESRQARYRLTIHNEDNPPLEITGVQAEGAVYRLVFLAHPNNSYQIAYGSASASTPMYDASTVLTALRRENSAMEATLGPAIRNAKYYEPAPGIVQRWFDNWVFLGTMIGLMVIVLGWILLRAGHRIGQLSDGS